MVVCKNERGQIRNRFGERRCDSRDAVARKEECTKSWAKREVCEGCDVVVGEVDCILVLKFSINGEFIKRLPRVIICIFFSPLQT